VRRWLKNSDDPTLVVAEDVDEDGASRKRATPIRFAAADFHTPAELAAAMSGNWTAAMNLWLEQQQKLRDWLYHDLGDAERAEKVKWIDENVSPEDKQLFSVIRALDSTQPPSFKGKTLTVDSVAEAAETAVAGDHKSGDWLRELNDLDILSLAATSERSLAGVVSAWNAAKTDYQARSVKVSEATEGGVSAPELNATSLPILLGAAAPGASAALEALRERARSLASRSALSRLWFSELGEPRTASPAAALLMTLLAAVAEGEVDASRGRRAQRNDALWGHMGGGATIAALGGLLWWGGAGMFCGNGNQFCTQFAWQSQSINPVDLIYGGAAVVAVISILVTVHARTTSRD
jgi:hypothetical protein